MKLNRYVDGEHVASLEVCGHPIKTAVAEVCCLLCPGHEGNHRFSSSLRDAAAQGGELHVEGFDPPPGFRGEKNERKRVCTVRVEDSTNHVTYMLLSDHGTVNAEVRVEMWGERFTPSGEQVMAAFALLVPGAELQVRWVPYPMGAQPHTKERREQTRKWEVCK